MTVFRGYLLLMKRNIFTIVMYIAIFVGICVAIQKTMGADKNQNDFSSVRIKTAVLDREEGSLGKALKEFLGRNQELVSIADEDDVIQEELYYRNVTYVLVVEPGAESRLAAGEQAVTSISVPGTVSSYYAEASVQQFLNQIRVYVSCGYSMDEACRHALSLGEERAPVTMLDRNGNGGVRPDYNYYFAYMPYAFLGASIMSLSVVIMAFKKQEIRRRMAGSPLPFWKQSLAMALCFFLGGALIWGSCMGIQAFLYQGGCFLSTNWMIYLLNSLACILVALSLGFFSGTVAQGPASLSAICNVISLGLCFLGGIFVPIQMLGTSVERAARFLPTYWYSVINEVLGNFESLPPGRWEAVWFGLLIQILFALAVFGVTLVLRRRQLQSEG